MAPVHHCLFEEPKKEHELSLFSLFPCDVMGLRGKITYSSHLKNSRITENFLTARTAEDIGEWRYIAVNQQGAGGTIS